MPTEDDPYSRVDYRRLIAWPERIRREAPLLEEVFAGAPSRRLLDLGCGPGEHARFLASRGFSVLGVDASQAMLDKALEEPLPPQLAFLRADLRELGTAVDGAFGGALCLGNTLPHILTRDGLTAFLAGLRRRLEPGAPFLLQILNYDRIFDRNERFLPLNFRSDEGSEAVFLRLLTLLPDGGVLFYPTSLRLTPGGDPPVEVMAAREVRLQGWRRADLALLLAAAGFPDQTAYGDFERGDFAPLESRDLLLLAR